MRNISFTNIHLGKLKKAMKVFPSKKVSDMMDREGSGFFLKDKWLQPKTTEDINEVTTNRLCDFGIKEGDFLYTDIKLIVRTCKGLYHSRHHNLLDQLFKIMKDTQSRLTLSTVV